jgi:ABC-type dipeptide/oligopeptide/nickel transport system ATPase component
MTILHDVNLQIGRADAGLVGESGSGKNMMALLRLVPAPGVLQSGSVQLRRD